MDATKRHRQLAAALVGDDYARKWLYLTNATFHASIDLLAHAMVGVVDKVTDASTAQDLPAPALNAVPADVRFIFEEETGRDS